MPDSPDVDYLNPFIEATNDAAARFRRVLIVMITASVLAFGASWNSKEHGWFNTRVMAARKGEAYLALEDAHAKLELMEREPKEAGGSGASARAPGGETQKVEGDSGRESRGKRALLVDVDRTIRRSFNRQPTITGAEGLWCELASAGYDRARAWIRARAMPNEEQAGQYALKLEEARTANVILVNIPFFGLVFDVNDLGLLGGFTFTVILLVFKFTLWREYNNLRLTFRAAKPEHLEYCYKSLAMQQVMTVPPTLAGGRVPRKPGGKIVRFLYLPPVVAQAYILYQDYSTMPIGALFHERNTWISMFGSAIFLVLIALLTVQCLRLSVAIDREWRIAADEVRKAVLDLLRHRVRPVRRRGV